MKTCHESQGRSLHHEVLRASGRTAARVGTGQGYFMGPSSTSEEAAWCIVARNSPDPGSHLSLADDLCGKMWRKCCADFHHSAGFHDRVVVDTDAFRLVVLREVDDAQFVLGVDRVVPIVVRLLVSWQKERMRKKMCSWCTAGEKATKGETCTNQEGG